MRAKLHRLIVEQLESRELLSTFYVTTTGADGSAGSKAAPWQTLQHAVDAINPGDTILVESGTYAGCRIGRSGQTGAVCTLKADTGASVIISTPGAANKHGSDIEVESFGNTVTNWVIDGLQVDNAPSYGIDVRVTDSITVQNCNVHNNTKTGIFFAFSDHPLVFNNVSASNGEHGIYDSNSGDYPTIRGNKVHDNADSGIHMNGDLSQGGDGIITGALVERNTIYNNGAGGGSGINADGVQNSTFQNNLLYNNLASGISLFRIDGGGASTGNLVVNNTVVMSSNSRWALNIQNASTGNTVYNNILENQNPAHGSIDISSDSLASFLSDYNAVANGFTTDGSTVQTLAQWRLNTGQDNHSILPALTSLFVNFTGNDYHLLALSPAVDAGNSTKAPSTDLDGNPRPSGKGFDIGAYEYQVAGQATATFVKTDLTTHGTWKGVYGAQGYNVLGDTANYPSYATVSASGQLNYVWAGSTTDVRALQKAATGSTDREAACWYNGTTFTVDVNLTDGQKHQLALYLLDWDSTTRSERIDILDAATGAVLDSQTTSLFNGGKYVVWNLTGQVQIRVTSLAGANAVVSGLFFDVPSSSTQSGATATFVKTDAATQGTWKGVYGSQGYNVLGDTAGYPSYATVNASGQLNYVWSGSTTDVRALQKAATGSTDREAACWYNGTTFTVDVNLTDGQAHQIALYLLDWDSTARSERVDIVDAVTGAVLNSQTAASFNGGKFLVWNLSGHVQIKITRLAGANAVLSGLFFG